MILTEKNIKKWKKNLDKKMKEQYKQKGFSKTRRDREWIEEFEGTTEQHAIDEEVQYWDE